MGWKDRAQPVTDADTGGGWKARAVPVEDTGPSATDAALSHFGNAASLGYLPQLTGAAMKGVGYLSDVAAGVPEDFRGGDDYTKARDAQIADLTAQEKAHPTASTLGSIGGALAGGAALSPLMPAGGASAAARIGKAALGGAATGFLANPGDQEGNADQGLQLGDRAGNAVKGGLIGGALQGVGEAVKKGIGLLSPKSLDEFAETKALKSAGAMKKDFKSALEKGRVKDLGRTLLDESVDLTDPKTGEAVTQKLLQAGDTFEDIAKKTQALKDQSGKKIASIYKTIQTHLDDPALAKMRINPKDMAEDLRSKLQAEFGDSVDGPEVMEKVGKYVDRIWGKGDQIDLGSLLKVKNEFDAKINYAKRAQELPEIQKAYLLIRNHIRDTMNGLVTDVGGLIGGKMGEELLRANKLYGNATQLADMATAKMAGENANRMFGLTDTIAGTAGAGAGAMIGHDVGGVKGGIEGAVLGAGAALANKVGRTYGNPIMASGANAMSQGIQRTGLVPVINIFQNAATAGVQSGVAGGMAGGLTPQTNAPPAAQKLEQRLQNRTLGSQPQGGLLGR